eukprot:180125_1
MVETKNLVKYTYKHSQTVIIWVISYRGFFGIFFVASTRDKNMGVEIIFPIQLNIHKLKTCYYRCYHVVAYAFVIRCNGKCGGNYHNICKELDVTNDCDHFIC